MNNIIENHVIDELSCPGTCTFIPNNELTNVIGKNKVAIIPNFFLLKLVYEDTS